MPGMDGMGMMAGLMPSMTKTAPSSIYVSREQVKEITDQHEQDVQLLRTRMEQDFERYQLVPHVNTNRVTGEPEPNYAVYTSNAPRVFADKIISWQVLSKLMIRVPHVDVGGHEEEQDNFKERYAIGNLRSADERLRRMLQPSLRAQLAFFSTVRGGYLSGRSLLVKNPRTGQTYADITAFDPLHVHWGIGPDGLEWLCYKIKKTRAQIRKEYGVDVQEGPATSFSGPNSHRGSHDPEVEGIEVYDFYDGLINTVVTDLADLKPPTLHGSPRVPCFMTVVGAVPLLQSDVSNGMIAEVGESVFAPARETWKKKNDLMSIFQEIVERARSQSVVLESKDGKKTLPEDPFVKPTQIATQTGDKIYTLELQKMAQETLGYLTLVTGEEQRATLPYSAYGETPFQLSGFAITQLRQATETVLSSRIEALENCYLQISHLLYDQFMTGAFDGMQLSGVDSKRAYFSQMITPELMQNTCDYEVTLTSQLPQDDMARWTVAQTAKTLGLMSDKDILDTIVGVQDSEQMLDKVRTQKAEEGLPEAQLYTLMMAAFDRGEMEIAKMYVAEFQRLMLVKLGVMPDFTGGGGKGQGQGTPAKAPGARPEVMPNAMTGASPQPETSNSGPSRVAPGSPRPGAQGQSA